MFQRTKICSGLLLAFGGSLLSIAPGAFAQDNSVQRVEITGSSIKRIDAETSVPVTVIKADDLKKQGVTSVEQLLQNVTAVQANAGTSQVIGASTGGATFADARGIGADKTLILLNGRRIANNAFAGSAPDLNMIPFAAIEWVEILRDGASALYGTDAIGGVINFITRKDYRGGAITLGMDAPQHAGGASHNAQVGFGIGDLQKDGINVFGFVDFQKQSAIGGTQRPFNTRIVGGLSPTPFPANYFQGGDSGNPAAPDCSLPNLTTSATATACQETTSKFVDYIPSSERISGLLKASVKLTENHTLGLEGFVSHDKVRGQIAPVPYGGLTMNRLRPDGSPNPYYPGNPGSSVTPNIPLDPAYTEEGYTDDPSSGLQPGFIHVKWRDLAHGPRTDQPVNDQMRLLASLEGNVFDWDYNVAAALNTNTVKDYISGYSNGLIIGNAMRDGVLNPFGPQDAAGNAVIAASNDAGLLQSARGTVQSIDGHASRDLGDWFKAGRPAAIAVGVEARHETFVDKAEPGLATEVQASTGIDPGLYNAGSRKVYAVITELSLPVLKSLELSLAARYDHYSDFGSTTNPKFGFRFQPIKQVLLRGSFSTGFRAPSLFELYGAPAYTNTGSPQNDPINCPNGNVIAGHSTSNNCQQQFQALTGGNVDLKPEKAKNATLGLVLEPIQDLTAELDFWSVKFRHAIGTVDEDTVFSLDNYQQYTSVYHRNGNNEIPSDGSACPGPRCGYVDFRNLNLGGITTNGVDIALAYKMNAGSAGRVNFNYAGTWIHRYAYQLIEGAGYVDNVGTYHSGSPNISGPVFRWQHNANVTWDLQPFSLGLAGHYKSGYIDKNTVDVLDATGNPVLDPNGDPLQTTRRVSSYATFDLFGTYSFAKSYTITVGVKNVFDRDPPFSNQDKVFQAGYDPRFTDPTGRAFYARGTYSF